MPLGYMFILRFTARTVDIERFEFYNVFKEDNVMPSGKVLVISPAA